MKRLRWKKEGKETGIRKVFSQDGYYYHDGENIYARVGTVGGSWKEPGIKGWYFYGNIKGKCINTVNDKPFKTEAEAKEAASKWVKKTLKETVNE